MKTPESILRRPPTTDPLRRWLSLGLVMLGCRLAGATNLVTFDELEDPAHLQPKSLGGFVSTAGFVGYTGSKQYPATLIVTPSHNPNYVGSPGLYAEPPPNTTGPVEVDFYPADSRPFDLLSIDVDQVGNPPLGTQPVVITFHSGLVGGGDRLRTVTLDRTPGRETIDLSEFKGITGLTWSCPQGQRVLVDNIRTGRGEQVLRFDDWGDPAQQMPWHWGPSFSEWPYDFSTSVGDLWVSPAQGQPTYNDSPGLFADPGPGNDAPELSLRRADQLPFDLLSIDVDEIWRNPNMINHGVVLECTGHYHGGGSIQQTFASDGLDSPSNQRVVFAGFVNLDQVTWTDTSFGTWGNVHQIDDVRVATLADALDTGELPTITEGRAEPFVATPGLAWSFHADDPNDPEDTYDGFDCAMASNTGGGVAVLLVQAPATGKIRFKWRKTNPDDTLELIGNTPVPSPGGGFQTFSASTAWQELVVDVWCIGYLQFDFTGAGSGMLDDFEFIPTLQPVQLTPPANLTVAAHTPVELPVAVTGSPTSFSLYKYVNGVRVPYVEQATSTTLRIAGLEESDAGVFTLEAQDPCSLGDSYPNLHITVLPGSPSPNLVVNGSFEVPFVGGNPGNGAFGPLIQGWAGDPFVAVSVAYEDDHADGRNVGGLGEPGAWIAQTFATRPNGTHRLRFRHARGHFAGTANLSVQVIGATTTEWVLPLPDTLVAVERVFVATAAQTTLRFAVLDSSNPGQGGFKALLDEVEVVPIEEPPVANPLRLTLNEAHTVPIPFAGFDVGGRPLTFRVVSLPQHGTLGGYSPDLPLASVVTYRGDALYSGPDHLSYTVSNGALESAPVGVDIEVLRVNHPPRAVDDVYTASGPLTVPAPGLLANDTDFDGDALVIRVAAASGHGLVDVRTDGSFSYTPLNGYCGPDSFYYVPDDPNHQWPDDPIYARQPAIVTLNVLRTSDLNGDGCVDTNDLSQMKARLAADPTDLTYDLNRDGRFTSADLRYVSARFTNPRGNPCNPVP